MTVMKKVILTLGISVITLSTTLLAHEPVNNQEQITFKTVMQGLLTNMQLVTKGIVMDDYNQIILASTKIAQHPKPDIALRKKVMKNLAAEMQKFKSFDNVVHNAATAITTAAQEKNMTEVVTQYQTLIAGCQSCHAVYKARVAKILQ